MGKEIMWLAVTADELELPLCEGRSVNDLGIKLGVAGNTVYHMSERHNRSKYSYLGEHYKVVRIEV